MSANATLEAAPKSAPASRTWSYYLKNCIGPGLITGAADDDPSGIATYSIAGAQLGTSLLWTAFLTWPLMAVVQMMCARIGMVTGRGLAAAISNKFPKWVVNFAIAALLVANTINIGADLAGMADAAEMLSGVNSHFFVLLFAVGISWATVKLRYHQIASALKWLALILLSYVITAFVVHPHWPSVAKAAFLPSLPHGRDAWATLVAILGTTISPYLFFWQASQYVEEEMGSGDPIRRAKGATSEELRLMRIDVGFGAFASNIVMFFIILTTALTLHEHKIFAIETSAQAALALRPLAGNFAYLLFTVGILGVGFLAIPTLTGSTAYAFAESFAWRKGLDKPLRRARAFYSVILISTVAAVVIDFANINAVKALFWTAVINGLLAPFLLVGILLVASDTKLMLGQPSSLPARIVVAITTVAMFVAGIAMFWF
jgi:NRAMP (natural resistance-associated macrophage protein)-like metal ion transporter